MSPEPPVHAEAEEGAAEAESGGGSETSGSRAVPEHGVRFEVTRPDPADPASELVYRGFAHGVSGPSGARASVRCEVRVRADGVVASLERGDLPQELHAEIEKALSALVRATTRGPLGEGRLPPRKIVRWRPLSER